MPDTPGFKSLLVAHVYLFFSFKYNNVYYPCALVHWFSTVGDAPDDETTMWMVEPDYLAGKKPSLEVIHLEVLLRSGSRPVRTVYLSVMTTVHSVSQLISHGQLHQSAVESHVR